MFAYITSISCLYCIYLVAALVEWGGENKCLGTIVYSRKTPLKVKRVHSQLAELMYLTTTFAYGAQPGPSYKNAAARIESLACERKKRMHSPPFVTHSKRRAKKLWPFHPTSRELISRLLDPEHKLCFGP